MSDAWAMEIASGSPALGLLRMTPGIEALVCEGQLWIRGATLTERLDALLRQVPGRRFHITTANTLVPLQALLPVEPVPAGEWRPLADVVDMRLPPSSLPGKPPPKIPVRLVPCAAETRADFMLVPRRAWTQWVETAPSVRLRALRFALSQDTAAVHGFPLPPLPGMRHTERDGIVVPCGYTTVPAVDAATLAEACGLRPGDLLVLGLDGHCDLLPAEVFVPASRSAVRLSERPDLVVKEVQGSP